MESSPLLHNVWSSSEDSGDYPPVKSWEEARRVLWLESVKVWKIGAPIAFQLLCYYGINSVTTVFVGHIGELELSAVSIALSVIGTFSFGFLVIISLLLNIKNFPAYFPIKIRTW